MKKNFFFLKGVAALALAFTLFTFFTGCEEEPEDPPIVTQSKDVYLPNVGNPDVTVKITAGNFVALSWSPIIGVKEYQVWRSGGEQTTEKMLATSATTPTTITTDADGMLTYSDKTTAKDTQYTYTVLTIPYSAAKDTGKWEKAITTTYVPIFGTVSSLTVNFTDITSNAIYTTDTDTVTGFFAEIDLRDIKPQPGVTYTMERATLDKNNKPQAYQSVPLYKFQKTPDTLFDMTADMTADIFGNSNDNTKVYDRLPPSENIYQYRLKGVKNGVTDYIKASTQTTINFTIYLSTRISLVVNKTGSTFKVSPSFETGSRKNILQNNDKVVLYWLIGDKEECYKYGPYKTENSISFSKNDIESALATTPNGNELPVPVKTGSTYLYVQAWLERGNGDKVPLNNLIGDGLSSTTPKTNTTTDPKTGETLIQNNFQLNY